MTTYLLVTVADDEAKYVKEALEDGAGMDVTVTELEQDPNDPTGPSYYPKPS